jgi:hypothetical protein
MPFKPFPPDYKPEIDLLDRRQQYVDQLSSQKDKLIESAFLPLIKENILDYKGRLQCVVNHAKVETYYLDNIPVIEIHPLRWDDEYDQFGDPKLTCYWDYRILYKEKSV